MSAHRTMQVPSGELTVHVWNPAQSPRALVLLAHGYAEHAGRYEHVAQWLTDSGAMVVAPDHRGHGLSPGERGLMRDLDEYAEDLSVVGTTMAAEHEGLPTALIGHSMGGNIAIRFMQLGHGHDLRALVLSAPVAGGNPEVFALANHDPIPNVPVDPAVLSRDSDVGRAFRADPLVYHGPYLRETLTAYRTNVARIAASGSLGEVPTLWVHGELDSLAPLDRTRAALEKIRGPRFEEVVYAHARHEIFNEINAFEVLGDVVSFVTRCVTPT
ncbi:alpha-beta hydrolase superfamily lysophospholipase [Kribbella aluminosa]|uniref:Alpha-beta hydrolase superfamily lysophospholipase n=1 Tax=Kribbella aluminosa TaxID=416017 RepID=A0ABS4UIJ2_9ACTN|nr:alpha/beta hydrolase [Kribbella aluminosa]MBP2351439.1 alpha-beta hydrolase superfamily lysophospholipase [Kribbella aluminosa]